MYEKHFLLDLFTAVDYVSDKRILNSDRKDLKCEEIGDGNINYVFRVYDIRTGESVVLKQADVLLRSSGRPLGLERSKIEAGILEYYGKKTPGYAPEVYDYDANMCVLAMEDISDYKNMRRQLMSGKRFDFFAKDIAKFMTNVLLPTTDLYEDAQRKKLQVQKYINPELCDISEDLVFTEPYDNYKGRNVLTPGTEDFVKVNLYEDEKLKLEVCRLKDRFMNYAQALLHGDLHMGSIFINERGLKVIDPEFAFYGPMGYDSGNVIGNLFFPLVHICTVNPDEADYVECLKRMISETFDEFKKMLEKYLKNNEPADVLRRNEAYLKYYVREIMSDTVGYAGLEMIRRTVGDAKVMELTSITENSLRQKADLWLIKTAKSFIMYRDKITCGRDLIKIFED